MPRLAREFFAPGFSEGARVGRQSGISGPQQRHWSEQHDAAARVGGPAPRAPVDAVGQVGVLSAELLWLLGMLRIRQLGWQ